MKTFFDYSLKEHNTFGIDAYAEIYIVIESQEDVLIAINKYGLPNYIIWWWSNIILSPHILWVIRHIGILWIHEQSTWDITIWAGENWHKAVLFTIEKWLWWIENLIAIPWNVWASPVQNIGAYGVELQDVFVACSAYDTIEKKYVTLTKSECLFGYRDSIFKQQPGRYIILDVTLQLSHIPKQVLTYKPILDQLAILYPNTSNYSQQQIASIIEETRWSKLPKPEVLWNCGSFFKNPLVPESIVENMLAIYPTMPHYPQWNWQEKLSAAWLIDTAWLKWYWTIHVGTYEKQPLVIINKWGATQQDVILFSQEIISIVLEKTWVQLEREVNIL